MADKRVQDLAVMSAANAASALNLAVVSQLGTAMKSATFPVLQGGLKRLGKCFDITDPKYGAVGDDSTDNTTPIQNAINDATAADGWVYVPPGIFRITAAITTVPGPVSIVGAGRYLSVIKQMTSGQHGVILDDKAQLHHLCVRGTSSGLGAGVNGGNTDDSLIQDCVIEQFGGIGVNYGNNSTRNVIRHSVVQDNGKGGAFVGMDGLDNRILFNEFYRNAGANSIDTNGSRTMIIGNALDDCAIGGAAPDQTAIFLWSAQAGKPCRYNIVALNHINRTYGDAIRLDGGAEETSDNIVVANLVMFPGGSTGGGSGGGNGIVLNQVANGKTDRNLVALNFVADPINSGIAMVTTGASPEMFDNVLALNMIFNADNGILSSMASTGQIARNKVLLNLIRSSGTADYALTGDNTVEVVPTSSSPSALVATPTVSYLAAPTSSTVRYTTNAAGSILGGWSGGSECRRHRIVNIGAANLVINHEDGGATAANRFTSPTGANVTLGTNDIADVEYDYTSARWRITNITT